MRTMTDLLTEQAEFVKATATELITKHSRLSKRPNYEHVVIIDPNGDNQWGELSLDGKRAQSKAMADFRHFRDIVRVLIRDLPGDAAGKFTEAEAFIQNHIDQQSSSWCKTTDEAAEKTREAIDDMVSLVEQVHSPEDATIVIPDTNALLLSPRLEDWKFTWTQQFIALLTPTVLAELDELKIAHRNEKVRDKAEALVRSFKEYARRGDLRSGVPVVSGKISIRSIAIEPNVQTSLPWLDASNNDDRILASTIEVIRTNVRSIVVLVTADINLLNKAQHALIPVVEPPQPIQTQQASPAGGS